MSYQRKCAIDSYVGVSDLTCYEAVALSVYRNLSTTIPTPAELITMNRTSTSWRWRKSCIIIQIGCSYVIISWEQCSC